MVDVRVRKRVINVEEFIAGDGFGPVMRDGVAAPDLAGYTIKKIVDDPRSKHMVNIIKVDPKLGKYSHYHLGAETIWFVFKGTGLFKLDEKNEIPVGPGDFMHSFPGEIHGSTNTGTEDMYYLVVEGPLPTRMERDLKPMPYRQGRIMNLYWEIQKADFVPIGLVVPNASDLSGYSVKFLVPREDPRTKHLIEIVSIVPGAKKYHHWHDDAETVIVFLEGDGQFFLDEKESVPVKAGDIAHAFPGEIHGTLNTGRVPMRYLVVEGPFPPGPGIQMSKL